MSKKWKKECRRLKRLLQQVMGNTAQSAVAVTRTFEVSRRDYDDECPADSAIIFQSELEEISRYILDYPDIETGGELFGFWTVYGVPVVLFAIGPGPNSIHQYTSFNQDVPYFHRIGMHISERYGLQHIGEWHSHHRLGLDHPSSRDENNMVTTIQECNLKRFLLCIGNVENGHTTLKPYNFSQCSSRNYSSPEWDMRVGVSPFRTAIMNDDFVRSILVKPETSKCRMGEFDLWQSSQDAYDIRYPDGYWLNDVVANKEFGDVLGLLKSDYDIKCTSLEQDEIGCVHLICMTRCGTLDINFVNGFPDVPPVASVNGAQIHFECGKSSVAKNPIKERILQVFSHLQKERAL